MKKIISLFLILAVVLGMCALAFSDDAVPAEIPEETAEEISTEPQEEMSEEPAEPAEEVPADSGFALLNRGASLYEFVDSDVPAAFLGQNAFVKVIEDDGGRALVQWEHTRRFNGEIDGEAWIDVDALDMISEDDFSIYCFPYPDLIAWLGKPKEDHPDRGWIEMTADEWDQLCKGDNAGTVPLVDGKTITSTVNIYNADRVSYRLSKGDSGAYYVCESGPDSHYYRISPGSEPTDPRGNAFSTSATSQVIY